jgi:hypothetical protein
MKYDCYIKLISNIALTIMKCFWLSISVGSNLIVRFGISMIGNDDVGLEVG